MIALAACTLRRDRKVLQALVVVKLALPARLVRPAPRAAQGPQGPVEESLGAFEKYLSDDSPSAQVSRSTRRSGGGLNSGSGFVLLLLFRAVGWAEYLVMRARIQGFRVKSITSLHIVVRPAFSGSDIRPPSRVSERW